MMVGEFEVTALLDGTVHLPLDALLAGIDAESLEAKLARAGQSLPVEVSINAYLVNTGSHLVLIDTGAGDLFGTRGGGKLTESLVAAGYSAADVDAILLTHVHADHSGGLTRDGSILFPNAVVHVAEADKAHWFNESAEVRAPQHQKHSFAQGRASLLPYIDAGQLRTFSGAVDLLPGLRSIPAPGHTPGHTLFSVESAGERLVIWGDVVHSALVQIPCPEVTIRFDSDEGAAAAQRLQVFRDAAREGWMIGAAHISFPGLGRLSEDNGKFTWIPMEYSVKLERLQKASS